MSECLRLKKSNCKNCYKCIRHCPVKAIRFSGNQAHIVGNECILCGQCFVVCPQNAKEISDETEKVKVMIQGKEKVIASIAPSFIANYNGTGIEDMRTALKKLGFYDAEETAYGATIVKNEYEKMLKDGEKDVIITSCCHSVNLLIQKHFPAAIPFLADVLSPMQAHCQKIKKEHPDAKTVFIGPCVAKKDEAEYYKGFVDAVLTFENLTQWLNEENITRQKSEEPQNENSRARFFPTAGGILKTLRSQPENYSYLTIDGVENCMAALKNVISGKIHKCFIEMSACTGSCSGGPVMEKYHPTPVNNYVAVSEYAGKKDFAVEQPDEYFIKKNFEYIASNNQEPTEEQITEILHQMNKTKPEDELNCGSCGYNTCRDKAVAIFQGKAEISMCLPYLKDRAESFSDNIVNNTPNAIIVLNERLEVQQINAAAKRIMNIHSDSDVLGSPVISILDQESFLEVLETGKGISGKLIFLAEYNKYVEQSIIYDKNYHVLICIMRDITDEQAAKIKQEDINNQTVELADKTIAKQIHIMQEVAYLLGESAAETKNALTKLKGSIKKDE